MSGVDWDKVGPQAKVEQEASGGPLGTVVFVVLLVIGLIAGGAYVNSLMLSGRVRDVIVSECEEPTCSADVQLTHAACFDEHVSYGMPESFGDFQTPKTSPKLGIGSVDLDAYRACVMPKKPKTLAESESK